MQSLGPPLQPLMMQCRVDVARANIGDAIALLPGCAKRLRVGATTIETWPMAGRERGRFGETKQVGPAAPAHRLAAAAAEFANAGDPGLARPAPRQRLGCG